MDWDLSPCNCQVTRYKSRTLKMGFLEGGSERWRSCRLECFGRTQAPWLGLICSISSINQMHLTLLSSFSLFTKCSTLAWSARTPPCQFSCYDLSYCHSPLLSHILFLSFSFDLLILSFSLPPPSSHGLLTFCFLHAYIRNIEVVGY